MLDSPSNMKGRLRRDGASLERQCDGCPLTTLSCSLSSVAVFQRLAPPLKIPVLGAKDPHPPLSRKRARVQICAALGSKSSLAHSDGRDFL